MYAIRPGATVRIVIQARTDSVRLPAKALLPIGGIPSAILAAQRAANTGHRVVLATTDRDIDDALVRLAADAGLQVFRGNADDVRARTLAACTDLADDATIVRLTADNVLPDGAFVDEQLQYFLASGHDYINTQMLWRDPPYGLSAEFFRLGVLRAAAVRLDTPEDREHVTASIRASAAPAAAAVARFGRRVSAIRCTMDTFDDFERLTRLFSKVANPLTVHWNELVNRLAALPDSAPGVSNGARLVLGTAQLAAPYGSAGVVHPPSRKEGIQLVRRAIELGVAALDTARAYPGSEDVIGRALDGGWAERTSVVTKLSPLAEVDALAPDAVVAAAAEISVLRSLRALGRDVRPYLLVHRASHLSGWNGAVWKRLLQLRAAGLIGDLGVSVQNPDEALLAIENPDVRLMQMPFNVLDCRWERAGVIEALQGRPDLIVHVRSIYLQGLLLRDAQEWPRIDGCNASEILEKLRSLAQEMDRDSVADLCVAWVRSHSWIRGVVVGMERMAQLEQNAEHFSREPLSSEEAKRVVCAVPQVCATLLNPALWPHPGATS